MRENKNIWIVVVLIIVLISGGYYLLKDSFTEWMYNLEKTEKNAYGTFLFYELVKEKNKKTGFIEIDKSVIETFRKLDKNKTYNYLFLDYTPYYDTKTLDTLCQFVKAGNTAFIACENLTGKLLDSILEQEYQLTIKSNDYWIDDEYLDTTFNWKNTTYFNFIHPSLKDAVGYKYFLLDKADTLSYQYNQFVPVADSLITKPFKKENNIVFTAYENSNGIALNMAVLTHGKGKFVLLLSALPFTNYFMRNEKGLEYVEKVFSFLPPQTTIWDDVSKEYKFTADSDEEHQKKDDASFGESPLYFILKHPSFKWAWYLIIFGVIIYAIFHAKRRQNIIPIIESKENNSLKYVETIGQLYFHKEEHHEIANEMRMQFLNFLRQKYHIKTNEIDDFFFKTVALKSAVEEDKIRELFEQFKAVEKIQSIDQEKLHNINNKLEYFYTHCK